MLIPIVALGSLVGLSFLRRDQNGHAEVGERLAPSRIPSIMRVLQLGAASTVEELESAITEAKAYGLTGALAIFEEARAKAVLQTTPAPDSTTEKLAADQGATEESAEALTADELAQVEAPAEVVEAPIETAEAREIVASPQTARPVKRRRRPATAKARE